MTISSAQIKLLWVVKRKLGWSEEALRSVLAQIAGVTSTKELDPDSFGAVMGFAEYCGFTPLSRRGPNYGDRPGVASFAQIELIRNLWSEYTHRKAGEDELNTWLEHYWKISSLRFLPKETAPEVIATLKVMKARAA